MLAIHVAVLVLVYGAIAGARLAGFGVAITRGSVDASIPSGSVVVGRWIQPAEVRRGQQLIFEERRGARVEPPRLHRILDVQPQGARLIARTHDPVRGETLYVLTNPVVEPVFTLRFVGALLAVLLTPIGWLIGLALPACLLAFVALWYVWQPEELSSPAGHPASLYAPPRA